MKVKQASAPGLAIEPATELAPKLTGVVVEQATEARGAGGPAGGAGEGSTGGGAGEGDGNERGGQERRRAAAAMPRAAAHVVSHLCEHQI